MTEEAKQARREYGKRYRETHKAEIAERRRKWRKEHPDMVKAQNARYWARKAAAMKAQEVDAHEDH